MAIGAVNVDVQGLTQRFGRTTVLDGLDLEVGTGVFGLLGPNGAGKTTLLRTLATIVTPKAGALRLLGYNPDNDHERRFLRRRLGYLPQQLGYYPNFTVVEFVEYFALLKEMPSDEIRPAVARAIQRVGLEERGRSKLKTLSGGMLRLFTIEARRSIALWLVVPLAALVVWGTVSTMRPDGSPAIWARSSVQLGLMCVVAAFIMCGVGAWAAGRGRRRQTEELLATMPRPVSLLDVALLAGTAAWGLIACLLAGGLVFVLVDREATWGGLELTPIVVGLLSVVAGTAVGYLGGTIVPGRFAAPLMAVVFATAVLIVGTRSTAVAYLSTGDGPTRIKPA